MTKLEVWLPPTLEIRGLIPTTSKCLLIRYCRQFETKIIMLGMARLKSLAKRFETLFPR